MMKKGLCLILAAVCLLLCSCSDNSGEEFSADFYAMDTFMRITAYGKGSREAVAEAQNRVFEMERLWSVTDADSELFAVNHGGAAVSVSAETAEIIAFALEISEKTGGALDPTIYPVLTAWGFTTGENRVPSDEEIARLLEKIGYDKVEINGKEVGLADGMMLDLGAVAKGRASAVVADILRENGIKSALIDLGGNIMTVGTKPDGSDWRIGLKDPSGEGNVGVMELSDCAAVTSGKYERFFTAPDGTVYGHIIDPASGYPVDNDLLSATIVAADGGLCDALSTAVFVMGREKAVEFWRENGGFDMVLITNGGEILVTEGLESRFRLTDGSLSLGILRS